MTHVKSSYVNQVKVSELQIKEENKASLKHISTIYILRQPWFLVLHHIRTPVIYCHKTILYIFQEYSSRNAVIVLSYKNKVEYIQDSVLPTTCMYQHCGEKDRF